MTTSMNRSRARFVLLVALSTLPAAAHGAAFTASSDTLPSPGGKYQEIDPPIEYPGRLERLLEWAIEDIAAIKSPESLGGGNWQILDAPFTFNYDIQFEGSPPTTGTGEGMISGTGVGTDTRVFDIEIVSLSLVSSSPVMVRMSPTIPSMGQTTIESLPSGDFRIDSFFDIFTEISLDGGVQWFAAAAPVHMTSVPEPSALFLLAAAAASLGAFAGCRRWR